MQMQLFREQRLFSSIFASQPTPTAAAHHVTKERLSSVQQEVMEEIEEKQERILELKKEIGDDEEAFLNAEEDDFDIEPEEGEEVIFDAVVPQLEADLEHTRAENEEMIRELEGEIEELEAKLV